MQKTLHIATLTILINLIGGCATITHLPVDNGYGILLLEEGYSAYEDDCMSRRFVKYVKYIAELQGEDHHHVMTDRVNTRWMDPKVKFVVRRENRNCVAIELERAGIVASYRSVGASGTTAMEWLLEKYPVVEGVAIWIGSYEDYQAITAQFLEDTK